MNDTGWPNYSKQVKRKTDLQSENKGTGLKWHPFCYWHRIPRALPLWSYPQWPYLRRSGWVFSLRSLLSLPRLSNKCVTNQFRMALTRRLKELSLSLVALIINPAKQEWLQCTWCTRLPYLWYTRPLLMRYKLSLQRLLPLSEWKSSSRNLVLPEHTKKSTRSPKNTKKLWLNWPLGSHSNWIAWTPSARVEHTQGYFTTKKSEPRSFGFPPQFPTRVGRFFI